MLVYDCCHKSCKPVAQWLTHSLCQDLARFGSPPFFYITPVMPFSVHFTDARIQSIQLGLHTPHTLIHSWLAHCTWHTPLVDQHKLSSLPRLRPYPWRGIGSCDTTHMRTLSTFGQFIFFNGICSWLLDWEERSVRAALMSCSECNHSSHADVVVMLWVQSH